MPSIDDVYNQLVEVNSRLVAIDNDIITLQTKTDAVKNSVDNGLNKIDNTLNAGFVNISQGISDILQQQVFTNTVLVHLSDQMEAVICALENISENTCKLLNEAHIQTELQTSIQKSSATLLELYKTVHPEAALDFERREGLHQEILECCPPPEPRPECKYKPCEAPPHELGKVPTPEFKPLTQEEEPK